MHKEKFAHLEGKLRKDKFSLLELGLQRQENVFTVTNKSNKAAVYASFTLT
jgi:hypothetical protein